ncbi:MAG: polysaccharide pyruvyl transferase family protein [Marinobacter sp.]
MSVPVEVRPPRLAVFGAAPDTPNMGVSALYASILHSIGSVLCPVDFVVFDNGLGAGREGQPAPSDVLTGVTIIRHGARVGRRYYLPENLRFMAFAARLGSVGPLLNRAIRLIDSCDAVLDISGGDSFSDIYGRSRFNLTYLPKAIAIARGKPLLLLPQTYGPFQREDVRRSAKTVLGGAAMAWARDDRSFEVMKELLGRSFDPERHQCGLDMAFGLPAMRPESGLDAPLKQWLADGDFCQPLVGFNISGLIYNDPASASRQYKLKADYRRAVIDFLSGLLARTRARIVLIPHVMDRPGHYESDLAACHEVAKAIPGAASRLCVAPENLDQSEVKWLISQMQWFCGTRMHSTIAALSSAVPTAAIAYSDKTLGVFETCGQGAHVWDPRFLNTSEIVAGLWESFLSRSATAAQLLSSQQGLQASLDSQTSTIVHFLREAVVRSRTLKSKCRRSHNSATYSDTGFQ